MKWTKKMGKYRDLLFEAFAQSKGFENYNKYVNWAYPSIDFLTGKRKNEYNTAYHCLTLATEIKFSKRRTIK